MTEYNLLRRKIIMDSLDRYPRISSRTLARMLVRDNPLVFESIEEARGMIRYYRGQKGQEARNKLQERKYITYEESQPAR